MDTFGFTRKKFSGLAAENRHRHLIRWLTGIYQTLTANRVSASGFNLFLYQYEAALSWLGSPAPPRPDSQNNRACLAYVSDAIHFHRRQAGITARDHTLLPAVATHDRPAPGGQPPDITLAVALDGLRSLFNVGSIFRTCEAAGVRTLILGNTPGKEDPRVQKTAMGAHQWVEQEKTGDLFQALSGRRKAGSRIIGVDTVAGSHPCHCYDWPGDAVLVFGNEEYGISDHVMTACDDFVHIPMFGRKNSINVAAAVSVVLFQALLPRS